MASPAIPIRTPVPAYREDLESFRCPHNCGGTHPIDVAATCHPDADFIVAIDKEEGVLIVDCAVCDEPVLTIKIASRLAMDAPPQRM